MSIPEELRTLYFADDQQKSRRSRLNTPVAPITSRRGQTRIACRRAHTSIRMRGKTVEQAVEGRSVAEELVTLMRMSLACSAASSPAWDWR